MTLSVGDTVIGLLCRVSRNGLGYSRDDLFFLKRLERFVALPRVAANGFNADQLRSRAIYSTYLECRERGLESEARAIVYRAPREEA